MYARSRAAVALSNPRAPVGSNDSNRRRQPRIEAELDVDVRTADAAFTGFSGNLSTGGMLVAWHAFKGRSPKLNEKLHLQFTLPGDREPIKVDAEVRWTRSRGVGTRFVNLSHKSRRALANFVALRAPLFDDA